MKKEQILNSSMEIIRQYGLEHLTMDEIARQCGISKKTIYQFFINKDSLLTELATAFTEQESSRFSEGFKRQQTGEEKMMFSFRFLLELSGQIPYSNLHYLQKYHPSCYRLFDQLHQDIFETLEREMKAGQQSGLVFQDVDPYLLCSLLRTQLQHFQKEYPRLQSREILQKWQQQIILAFQRSVLKTNPPPEA